MPRDRDLVRRAALVLSSERPLRELFDGLSALLESYVDASIVFIVIAGVEGRPVASYLYMDGRSGEPDQGPLSAQSTSARVFETGVPVRYERGGDWPAQHLVALHGKTLRPESAIFVPIVFGGERVGVLSVQSTIQGAYTEDDVVMLETCALYLGARIDDDERRKTAERYERLASVDVLTGVANRGAFDQALDREWRRACRSSSPISLLMIDVDFFKSFNDKNGHVAGDSCLQLVAGIAQECLLRPTDIFARYGGEEFAVVLPDTELENAVRIAETIRSAIERRAIPHEGSSLGRVSISAGAATLRPKAGDDCIGLVRTADAALYEAKQRGRNCVAADGYAATQAPAEPSELIRGNLASPRTRFIGRRNDCARLMVSVAEHRLTTIIGAGGVGKTRVALETARELAPGFPDGAWFVDLTAISDANELAPLVSSTLKGLVAPQREIPALAAALRSSNALILLDNCEHLIEACADLVAHLAAAPHVRVLATSREAMGAEGEAVYRVAPLEVDEGVALFLDRATGAGLTNVLASDAAISDVVNQLDCLPLAIELAAPRLTTMSFEELRAGLGDRLSLLRSASRRAPSRQQTLRALMDWSYRLLSPHEQRVFRRLAVFSGGWTRAAAVEVCAGEALSAWAVGAALDGLIEKSLAQEETVDGQPRMRMLEASREYAAEMLEASDDVAPAIERHARYFLNVANDAGARRERTPTSEWHRSITPERGNLQAALFALLDARRFEDAANVVTALRDWLWDRGAIHGLDIARRLEHVLDEESELPPGTRAALTLAVATTVRRVDPQRALALIEPVYAFYLEIGDMSLAASSLLVIAQSQLVLRGSIEPRLESELAFHADRMESERNLSIAAMLLNLLGTLHTQVMDDARLDRAFAAFERSIGLLEARGDGDRAGTLYGNSADVLFYLGDAEGAVVRARRGVDLIERSEERWSAAFQYMNLGHFATWTHDFDTARSALSTAMPVLQGLDGYASATIVDKFARLAYTLGRYEQSAQLLACADATFERNGIARQRRESTFIETMRAELEQRLGYAFDAAYRAGRNWTPEEAERAARAV
ncbi:MAG TPA: diguanylate cyclase [Candidatus Acidoferrales bacterium]|jgi:diguanylate cyclase (GGDEF)-like protein|nr:diguanylate cyclase [Candidatus Acidoferrales bacterium]